MKNSDLDRKIIEVIAVLRMYETSYMVSMQLGAFAATTCKTIEEVNDYCGKSVANFEHDLEQLKIRLNSVLTGEKCKCDICEDGNPEVCRNAFNNYVQEITLEKAKAEAEGKAQMRAEIEAQFDRSE